MKVLNVSYSDLFGGAAKSAFRIHKLINTIGGNFKSEMIVVKKLSNDKNVIEYNDFLSQLTFKFKNYFGIILGKIDNNPNPKSYNLFNSPILNYINKSNCDLVNLHWINAETLSIEDVKKINKPYVITMHDMWWICGTENYLPKDDLSWKNGKKNNFISNFIFNKKKKIKPLAIICPSKWLANSAKKSYLMKSRKIFNIAYPINQKIYYPKKIKKIINLNLKKNNKIKIFFGVFGDAKDPRKGIDLIIKSLNKIDLNLFELVVASNNILEDEVKFKIINLNYVKNEKQLSEVYNLCDIIVLASRLDNLPNVALEAQSCGKPIVAYDVGGISDIIDNGINGFLVKPFDTTTFSKKINILIKNKKLRLNFSKNAIRKSNQNWSEKNVKKNYKIFLNNLNIK